MTLSRHAQVEDLANLLSGRRAVLRERALRQQAYRRLTSAVLDQSSTGRQVPVPTRALASAA